MIDKINSLATPIQFKQNKSIPQILIFGEMGNGKSTTGNQLIRQTLKMEKKDKKPKKTQQFEAHKSMKAVTTKMDIKKCDKITILIVLASMTPIKTEMIIKFFPLLLKQFFKKQQKMVLLLFCNALWFLNLVE